MFELNLEIDGEVAKIQIFAPDNSCVVEETTKNITITRKYPLIKAIYILRVYVKCFDIYSAMIKDHCIILDKPTTIQVFLDKITERK